MTALTVTQAVERIARNLTTTQLGLLQHVGEGRIVSDTPTDASAVRGPALNGKVHAVTGGARKLAALDLIERDGRRWHLTPAGELALAIKTGGAR